MRILLTGGTGHVGWELRRALAPLGEVTAPGREALDLADPDALATAVRELAPELVVNAAAWTDVDGAEEALGRARAVNARAPGVLAEEAARAGAALLHYSTDYVFDGRKGAPYTEEDDPDPVNVYGETKLEGERAVRAAGADHLILRSSWVYGLRRASFLTTMRRLLAGRERVRVVDDRFGSPTWCRLLAEATALILARSPGAARSGETFHLAAAGRTSRHGFAAAIREELAAGFGGTPEGGDAEGPTVGALEPVSTEAYRREDPRPAARPPDTALDCRRAEEAFGLELPGWREALSLCLEGARGAPAGPRPGGRASGRGGAPGEPGRPG